MLNSLRLQRYKEFLTCANKNGFFDEKYRIVSDDNRQSLQESGANAP